MEQASHPLERSLLARGRAEQSLPRRTGTIARQRIAHRALISILVLGMLDLASAWCSSLVLLHHTGKTALEGRSSDPMAGARAHRGHGLVGMLGGLRAQMHESKRAKRRRRAPPSELQQWMTTLSSRPGGLKLMLDLDNNANAVPQLEAAKVRERIRHPCLPAVWIDRTRTRPHGLYRGDRVPDMLCCDVR